MSIFPLYLPLGYRQRLNKQEAVGEQVVRRIERLSKVRASSKYILIRKADVSCYACSLDAKHRPDGVIGSDVTGMRGATSGSLTDRLTREHRMTLDEARLILNIRKEDPIERVLQVCLVALLAVVLSQPLLTPTLTNRTISTTNTCSKRMRRHLRQNKPTPQRKHHLFRTHITFSRRSFGRGSGSKRRTS